MSATIPGDTAGVAPDGGLASTDQRAAVMGVARGSDPVAARRARCEALWARVLARFSEQELETATAVIDCAPAVFDEIAAESDGAGRRLWRLVGPPERCPYSPSWAQLFGSVARLLSASQIRSRGDVLRQPPIARAHNGSS